MNFRTSIITDVATMGISEVIWRKSNYFKISLEVLKHVNK